MMRAGGVEPEQLGVEGLSFRVEGESLHAIVARGEANSFSTQMTRTLAEAAGLGAADPRLRFLRIQARGDAFCLGRDREGETPDELREVAGGIVNLLRALRETSLIVICEVGGDAAGFGVGLVAASDVAVGSEDARFWFPELEAGLAPTIVLSWLARTLPRKQAFELVATGRRIAAEEALRHGLLTEVVPPDAVGPTAERWVGRLTELEDLALRDVKAFLDRATSAGDRELGRSAAELLALGSLRLRHRA